MSQSNIYSPAQRQREKQAARDQDDRDLRAGVISPADLGAANGFFSSLDLGHARIGRRGRVIS